MLKILLVIFVYLQSFQRSSLLICVSQPEIAKNLLKPLILKIQGHLRSWMLTFSKSSSLVLVIIASMSVPIFNHFYVRRANSGRITSLWVPFFTPSFEKNPFTQRHKIWSRSTRAYRLSYGKNQNFFSLKLRSVPGRDGQDRQNYRSYYALQLCQIWHCRRKDVIFYYNNYCYCYYY